MNAVAEDRVDTTFLRGIAILLIVNSHLDLFYPISNLATGGAVGNSLFFMLSGYGLYFSLNRNRLNFFEYYSKRFVRIFPPVWISLLLVWIPIQLYYGECVNAPLFDIVGNFFWPPFWFLKAILTMYIFIYFLIRINIKFKYCAMLSVYFLLYFWKYANLDLSIFSVETLPFKIINYSGMMVFGTYLAKHTLKIKYCRLDFLFFVVCILLVYIQKIFFNFHFFQTIQFMQQFLLYPTTFFFLRCAKSKFVHDLMINTFIGRMLILLSSITLEIYIVHTVVREFMHSWGVFFPMNVFLFVVGSVILAWIVNKMSSYFMKNA